MKAPAVWAALTAFGLRRPAAPARRADPEAERLGLFPGDFSKTPLKLCTSVAVRPSGPAPRTPLCAWSGLCPEDGLLASLFFFSTAPGV